MLCVGIAYFIVGVLVPVVALAAQGQLGMKGWSASGFTQATLAGTLGAAGAVCIIYAFRAGGLPTYVMPLVFGGAPLVNVLFSMYLHPPKVAAEPAAVGRLRPRRGGGVAGAVLQTARIATPRIGSGFRFSVHTFSVHGVQVPVHGSADVRPNPMNPEPGEP